MSVRGRDDPSQGMQVTRVVPEWPASSLMHRIPRRSWVTGKSRPAGGRQPKPIRVDHGKVAPLVVPGTPLNRRERPVDADQVERVQLLPATRRSSRSGLDQQRRVARVSVTYRRWAGMTEMQMAREDHVDPAPSKPLDGHGGTADHLVFIVGAGQIEGMVGHDNAGDAGTATVQAGASAQNLALVYPPVLEGKRAGGVDSEYRDLPIGIKRFDVVARYGAGRPRAATAIAPSGCTMVHRGCPGRPPAEQASCRGSGGRSRIARSVLFASGRRRRQGCRDGWRQSLPAEPARCADRGGRNEGPKYAPACACACESAQLFAAGNAGFWRHDHPEGARTDAIAQGRFEQDHFTIGCDCQTRRSRAHRDFMRLENLQIGDVRRAEHMLDGQHQKAAAACRRCAADP